MNQNLTSDLTLGGIISRYFQRRDTICQAESSHSAIILVSGDAKFLLTIIDQKIQLKH